MEFASACAGSGRRAKVLLKARPTPEQLADRVAPPLPEGLELYLDVADISGSDWLARLQRNIGALDVPSGFSYIVEGPLRSLDGSFFDISVDSEANIETLRRVCRAARAIGAEAVNIHCITPVAELRAAMEPERRRILDRSGGLLREYVRLGHAAGAIPLIENIPPVARMREGRFMTSFVGILPSDLLQACRIAAGLFVTLDVSHAQLYLNVTAGLPLDDCTQELANLVSGLRAHSEARDIGEYMDALDGRIKNVHVSNAVGVLGEGLPFDAGTLDMPRAIRRLGREADFLVTETLDPDPDRAIYMREAQRRIADVLSA